MKKIKLIYTVLVIMLIMTACRSTPEEPIVIDKGDDNMDFVQSNSISTSISSQYPSSWTEKIQNNEGSDFIDINATVKFPAINSIPIICVKPHAFSQGEVENLVQYFSQGKPLYSTDETMTKSDIEMHVIELRGILEEAKDGNEDLGTPEEIQKQIDSLEEQYENAPETRNNTIVDSTLKIQPGTSREVLDVAIDISNGEYARISLINCNESNYNTVFTYQNGQLYKPVEELYGKDAEGLNTTLIKATQEAEAMLKNLGIVEYEAVSIETGAKQLNSDSLDLEQQGYIIKYRLKKNDLMYLFCEGRDYTGITIDEKTGFYVYESTREIVEEFAPTWSISEISINIDDSGVTFFNWNNPVEIVESISDNVGLLPFNEVQRIFTQQMKSAYIYNSNGLLYHVDKIELGLAATAHKDNIGQFLMVPVWIFYGYCEDTNMPDAYQEAKTKGYTSILVLNAVNGSIIK